MNKLWLKLLGIGDEEAADLGRRGFLKMLGGAAVVAAAPTRVFMGGFGIDPGPLMFNGIEVFQDIMVPRLAENFFKDSPIFTLLRSQTDSSKRFEPKWMGAYREF